MCALRKRGKKKGKVTEISAGKIQREGDGEMRCREREKKQIKID